MRPDFHADFNGVGLNCDNDAYNEQFQLFKIDRIKEFVYFLSGAIVF